jgi:hypothetical protein
MEKNVLKFVKKWKVQEVDNIKVFPEAAIDAVDKLLVHITTGCLSGIPPGNGTNRKGAITSKDQEMVEQKSHWSMLSCSSFIDNILPSHG